MQNKLTARIAGAYLNAKYKHPCDACSFEFRGFKSPLDDIRAKEEQFWVVLYGDWSGGTNPNLSCESHTYISDCKLILKPLSLISDEDAIEVAKIYCPFFDFSGVIKSEVFQSKRIFHKTGSICLMPDLSGSIYDFDGLNICDLNYFRKEKVVDYLRSKSYDCGYGSEKSGIESGWAIE